MCCYIKSTAVLAILFLVNVVAQEHDTLWTRTYGGNLSDIGYSVLQTSDGGFIIAGVTESFGAGGKDVLIIKTDQDGNSQWIKTFGGSEDDEAKSINPTDDNGFIIAGSTESYGNGMSDVLLLKIDSVGNTQWFKTYGSITDEWGEDAKQLPDGGYVVVGDSNWTDHFGSSSWIIKTDSSGEVLWSHTKGNCCYDGFWVTSVQQMSDGGLAVCGTEFTLVYPFGSTLEFFLMKYSIEGDFLWLKSYTRNNEDTSPVLKKANDGNLIIGGTTNNPTMYRTDIWLLKVNNSGSILWQIVLGNTGHETFTNFEQTSDDGYIITKYDSLSDVCLIKTNETGGVEWERRISAPLHDRALAVQETSDSGYIVTGRTNSFGSGSFDVWLLRFDNKPIPKIVVDSPNGGEFFFMGSEEEINWTSYSVDSVKIELSLEDRTLWYTITEATPSDGSYNWLVEAPQTSRKCRIKLTDLSDSTVTDESDTTFIIEILPNVGDSSETNLPTEFKLYANYPNPFNPGTTIKFTIPNVERRASSLYSTTLKVYDILGNEVATLVNKELPPGEYEVEFNAANLPSGVYFYRLTAGSYSSTKKLMLLK